MIRQQRRSGVMMVAPAAVIILLLLLLPIGQAIYYSFTQWDGFTAKWNGISNYAQLFNNPTLAQVLINNLLLLIAVPIAVFIPFLLANLLNQHVTGWRIFRSIYFIPTAIPWAVAAMVSTRFFAQDGVLNGLLTSVGLGAFQLNLLSSQSTALIAVGITFIWSMVGTNTIIFLTGLATLDPSLEEAARIDRASAARIFFSITLPQLTRFIQFAFVVTTISAFTGLFSLIFIMTGGGPGNSTTTLEFFIYQQAFSQGNFGLASMAGVVLFVLIGVITIIQMRLFSRLERRDE